MSMTVPPSSSRPLPKHDGQVSQTSSQTQTTQTQDKNVSGTQQTGPTQTVSTSPGLTQTSVKTDSTVNQFGNPTQTEGLSSSSPGATERLDPSARGKVGGLLGKDKTSKTDVLSTHVISTAGRQGNDMALDGAFVGKNGVFYDSKTPIDQLPRIKPTENVQREQLPELVIHVNGIQNDGSIQSDALQKTSNQTGSKILGVHNGTYGIGLGGGVQDLAECLVNKAGKGGSPAETLTNVIYAKLTKDPPEPVHLMGHSQGGLLLSGALTNVKNRLLLEGGMNAQQAETRMGLLSVETFGGAAQTYPDGPKYVHYVNTGDIVPRGAGLGGGVTKSVGNVVGGIASGTDSVLTGTGNLVNNVAKGTGNVVDGTLRGTGNMVNGLAKGTGNVVDGTLRGTGNMVNDLAKGTGNVVDGTLRGTGNLVDGGMRSLGNTTANIANNTLGVLANTFGLGKLYDSVGSSITNATSGLYNNAQQGVSGGYNTAQQGVSGTYNNAQQGVSGGYNSAQQGVSGTYNTAQQGVSGGYNSAQQGVSGTYNTAQQGVGGTYNAIRDVGSTAKDWALSHPGKGAVIHEFTDAHGAKDVLTLGSHGYNRYLEHRVPFEQARNNQFNT